MLQQQQQAEEVSLGEWQMNIALPVHMYQTASYHVHPAMPSTQLSVLTSQQLRADVCMLERIMLLRPYRIERAIASEKGGGSNTILEELEAKVDASFTLSDLIAFNNGAPEYVARRYGSFGVQILTNSSYWHLPPMFHKDLASLWDRLSPTSQHMLENGMPIAILLAAATDELSASNAKKCLAAAKFRFEDTEDDTY